MSQSKDSRVTRRYTTGQIDRILDVVLAANTEPRFLGECDRLAAILERTNGDNVRRFVWGLATGTRGYAGPGPGRQQRQDNRATWGEIQFVRWAWESKSEEAQAKRPTREDIDYFVRLLNRDREFVERLFAMHGKAQGRGGGFGLE